jgi:hypothetical protein
MRNITVSIPDDCYARARVWAAQRDTSVSAGVKYIPKCRAGTRHSAPAFPSKTQCNQHIRPKCPQFHNPAKNSDFSL